MPANPSGMGLYYHANVLFCFDEKTKVTDHVSEIALYIAMEVIKCETEHWWLSW